MLLSFVEELHKESFCLESTLVLKAYLHQRLKERDLKRLSHNTLVKIYNQLVMKKKQVSEISLYLYLPGDSVAEHAPAVSAVLSIDPSKGANLQIKIYNRYWMPTIPLIALGEELILKSSTQALETAEDWSEPLFQLEAGDRVMVVGTKRFTAGGDYQYYRVRVAHNGREGWVAHDRLAFPQL